MLEYDRLTAIERARSAALIMENPVFVHIIEDEIKKCTEIAINSSALEEREVNRINVIWANHLKKRIVDHVKAGRVKDGG